MAINGAYLHPGYLLIPVVFTRVEFFNGHTHRRLNEFMGPRTPCPHPVRLRQFFREQDRSTGADPVRQHLAQCESCRLVVARIESGQDAEQDSLVQSLAQSRPAMDEDGAYWVSAHW